MNDDLLPDELDFARTYRALIYVARCWQYKVGAPMVFDGVSALDVVHETFEEFLSSPTRLGWDPHRGSLCRFLATVCVNKLYEHYRRHMGKQRSIDDPAIAGELLCQTDEMELFERKEFAIKMLGILKQRIATRSRPEELMQIVNAMETMGDSVLMVDVNKRIAEMLHISVRDVENGKKRLRRLMPELTNPGAN
jgi:DNA-directed RNA polymerase specialized sigma24 family protein